MPEVKEAKAADPKAASPMHLKGPGKKESLKVKDVFRLKELQARTDGTPKGEESDGTVDEGRAEQFSLDMKSGDKFPPVKVVRVKSEIKTAKGQEFDTTYVVWDGNHTHRGAELAKLGEIDALVWEGTAEQAMFMAATVANREHEKGGRAYSSKDKVRCVSMIARSYTDAKVPKKDWPSNRELADMAGVSRQLVNNIDPFDRAGKDRDEVNKAKRQQTANGSANGSLNGSTAGGGGGVQTLDPVTKSPCNFEIKDRRSGGVVARYHANNPEKAFERFTLEHKGKTAADHMAIPIAPPPKPSSAPGFDWSGVDGSLGFVVRGTEAFGDMFGLANSPEFKAARDYLKKYADYFAAVRKEKAGKK